MLGLLHSWYYYVCGFRVEKNDICICFLMLKREKRLRYLAHFPYK